MNLDWNWFFSSFCQSAAALIGIIAAFVISRLLGLNEKVNALISSFEGLVIEFNKIKSSLSNRHFYWYTKTYVKYNSKLKDDIKGGLYDGLTKEHQLKKVYENVNGIYKIDEAVEYSFNELYEKLSPVQNKWAITDLDLTITPNGLWDNLSEEKEAINKLEVESRTLIDYFNQNASSFRDLGDTIKPLRIIILVLMIAFLITVVYPLHFMPVAVNENPSITFNPLIILNSILTLKSVLLILFFLVIEGLFYYFLQMINSLDNKLRDAIRNNNEDYRNIKSFSEYFD